MIDPSFQVSELVIEYKELKKNLIQPQPVNNFRIQKYYQNKSKFIGIYSRNSLLKTLTKTMKDRDYVNIDK